jgi:hypothetical protein
MTEDDTFDALRKAPTEDQIAFGRDVWVYCDQHLAAHKTGWCTVAIRNKIKLDAQNGEDAYAECKGKGYPLYKG